MADGVSDEATLSAYADAQARLEHAGGYRWRDGIDVALHGLGFADDELDRPLASFSGGELTRASLARALASRPDLLLLDEPTNHLDIGALEWLEAYLVDLDAAVILVAHDRWFLESVGTSVLELEAGRGRYFKGPWHAWRAEQAARELAAGRDAARREAEIARMERFVERFRYKATKARQAQSKLKHIDRLRRDAIEPDPRDGRSLAFRFGAAERTGRVVLELERGDDRRRRPDPDRRRRPLARARRARLPRRRQRLGQEHAGRDPGRPSAIPAGRSCGAATTSSSDTSPSIPRPPAAPRPPCSRTPRGRPGSRRRRPGRCSGASCSPARRSRSGSPRSRAVRPSVWRWRC